MARQRHERLRIVVGGFIGLFPAAGVVWDYLQYVLGFERLGHDVYYVEDTGVWPVYTDSRRMSEESVRHVAKVMSAFDLSGRWAYRDEVTGTWFGMSSQAVEKVLRSTDVFVNVSCSSVIRDVHAAIGTRILIDSDPMFTQMQYVSDGAGFTPGAASSRELIDAHTHAFTFGESIATSTSRVPTCGVDWKPTRQPICIDLWPPSPPPRTAAWSTVMNWTAGPDVWFDGERWGQKNAQLLAIRALPARVPQLELSLVIRHHREAESPQTLLEPYGWVVRDPAEVVPDWHSYRQFLSESAGEISVAKHTYVKARTGWFSCRSACYLASGRPVIAEDTGWSEHLPHGIGLIPFTTEDDAVEALHAATREPARHGAAARAIAEECFASDRVLTSLLEHAGVSSS